MVDIYDDSSRKCPFIIRVSDPVIESGFKFGSEIDVFSDKNITNSVWTINA
jgi:hypothetical protein